MGDDVLAVDCIRETDKHLPAMNVGPGICEELIKRVMFAALSASE
jgi:hypothetical protein